MDSDKFYHHNPQTGLRTAGQAHSGFFSPLGQSESVHENNIERLSRVKINRNLILIVKIYKLKRDDGRKDWERSCLCLETIRAHRSELCSSSMMRTTQKSRTWAQGTDSPL